MRGNARPSQTNQASIVLTPFCRALIASAFACRAPNFFTANIFRLTTPRRGLQAATQAHSVRPPVFTASLRTPTIPDRPLRRTTRAQSLREIRPC